MSIVLITGNHPRHRFLVSELSRSGKVVGWIREVREDFVPAPPLSLNKALAQLFSRHFLLRQDAEDEFFGLSSPIECPTLEIPLEELNGARTVNFLIKINPKLVISYGCHKLDSALMRSIRGVFWNTHGGLSPEYRGVITHFWPSYFLEPQMTGMTLHETTDAIDGGAIIHQTSASMVKGDNLHQLAARTVLEYSQSLSALLAKLDYDSLPSGRVQKASGRIFKGSDWRPEHLQVIYDLYQDKIVDLILAGELKGREPSLISTLVNINK